MFYKTVLMALAGVTIAGGTPVYAQAQPSPAGVKRVSELGGFVSEAILCKTIGYDVNEDFDAYDQAIQAEGGRYGLDGETSGGYAESAMNVLTPTLQAQFKAATQGLGAEEEADVKAAVPRLNDFILSRAQRCQKIAEDPVGSTLIQKPDHEPETYARQYADSLLVLVGYASWQTPFIRAGGDVAEAVGVCEAHLTRAQAEAYVVDLYRPNRFSMAVEDKAVEFFNSRRKRGRDMATDADLDATQCNRLLTGRAAKLKAAPR